MRTYLFAIAAVIATSGCTVINTVSLPSTPGGREIFVTAGDIKEPHDVLGLVQVQRSGVLLFGNIDVVGTDIEAGLKDVLIPQIKEMGGDGAVRVRFNQTQYTPWSRVFGAIFFMFPLPSQVQVTAQVVKLRGTAPAAAPAPATTP